MGILLDASGVRKRKGSINMKKVLEKLFSIKNENNHKLITICCIKFKYRNKETKDLLLQHLSQQYQDLMNQTLLIKNALRVSTPLPNLRYFEVHLVEHCNLNCQCCTHWSPLAKEEYTDLQEFEKDCKRIAELTKSNVNMISLLGGEPLLHPQCKDFLRITRKYFPKTKIKLVTNGILLLNQDTQFWSAMAENNITLAPTKYPINVNWKDIELKAHELNVQFEYYNDANEIKTSFKLPYQLDGSLNPVTNFLACGIAGECIFLSHGKLYTCTQAANVKHFNNYFGLNLKEDERDYIDIYKAKDLKEILEFLAKPIPFCKYCNITKLQAGIPWKISKRAIEEWTL